MKEFKILSLVFLDGERFFIYKSVYATNKVRALKKHYSHSIAIYDYTKVINIKHIKKPYGHKFLEGLLVTFCMTVLVMITYGFAISTS